jgi:hypothetical protein
MTTDAARMELARTIADHAMRIDGWGWCVGPAWRATSDRGAASRDWHNHSALCVALREPLETALDEAAGADAP